MRTIEAEEAQSRFAEVLRDVEDGETVIIAVRGVPVAQFAPIQRGYKDAAEAIDDGERYREEHNITLGDDITIRELIEEGRDRRYEWLTRSEEDEDDRGA